MALFAVLLPMAAVADCARPDYDKQRNLNMAMFISTLPTTTVAADDKPDYDKVKKLIGSCFKVWQSTYSWDYIVRCNARDELVAISKKTPNTRFISIPKTDKEFARMAKPNKILVNVNPFSRSGRDGEIVTCYRIMANGTDLANLPDSSYAVNVCK